MQPAEAVLRFLRSVGPGSEAEFYLRLFREAAPHSFATIVVDAQTMLDGAEGVAMDLRFLNALQLVPVVVLGLYEQRGLTDNLRRLQRLLTQSGVPIAEHTTDTPVAAIETSVREGNLPVLQAVGAGMEERLEKLGALLQGLRTHRLIFLRTQGGLRPAGQRLSIVNLSEDADQLLTGPALDPGQKRLIEHSRRLIFELCTHKLLVSVTSPMNLLRELFTVKGAGTLLRRGARILRCAGLSEIDHDKLRQLLESSFERPPPADLFERDIKSCYLEQHYRGAALLLGCPFGAYLTKFAVTRQAQGEGIGRDLWRAMTTDHQALLWRARPDNRIRSWYERECDSRVSAGPWNVYFKGIEPSQIPAAVEFALAQPVDF